MKNAHLFAVALGAAGLALMSSAAPSLAHDSERMQSPYAPCGPTQGHYMERGIHHHGMMDDDHHGMMGGRYGMESGRGYGGGGGGPMMGPDERRGGRMGFGMMMDPDEMMAPGRGGMDRVLRSDLTTDEVRHMMEHQLEWMGNPNLKLGKVEESDDGEIIAEVVTQDGSLVQRLEVDPHTGRTRQAQ